MNLIIFIIGATIGTLAMYHTYKNEITELKNIIFYDEKGIYMRELKIKQLTKQLLTN